MGKRRRVACLALALIAFVCAAGVARAVCVGDCAGDGAISIDDLIRGVAIALGSQPLAGCPAFDADGDGQVGIAELVQGVNAALSGCAAAPSPTGTASPTVTPTGPLATATASEPPPSATATALASASATATADGDATVTATVAATASATAIRTATASPRATATRDPDVTPRPNFLVINLDDARFDGVDRMSVVLDRLAAAGVTFHNSFVPNSVCTPSRASLLTGLYSIHHGTRSVAGDLGGADSFRVGGADLQTIATWLHAAGYATGLFGKYLNDYSGSEATAGPGGAYYIPPGWERWQAMQSPEHYGGVNGQSYALVDESGAVEAFDDHTSDAQYSTDVLGARLREFIAAALQRGAPFFALYTPYAPHVDAVEPQPAQRHEDRFADLPPWRPPSWNEPDIGDKPHWVAFQAPDPFGGELTDSVRRKAYRSLLAVDEQIDATLDLLADAGVEADTMVILTGDNGVMWGEHRGFLQRKENAYEEAIRVPFIVRYPRLAGEAGFARSEPVLNIDIAPTIAAAAGVVPPLALDGESLLPLIGGLPDPGQRGDFLLERFRTLRGDNFSYAGQPRDGDRIRVLYGPTRQRPRPAKVYELDGDGVVGAGATAVAIGATADETFANLVRVLRATLPQMQVAQLSMPDRVSIKYRMPGADPVLFMIDVDQGGVLRPFDQVPDYVGVRDVINGYTYVEYETGEVELYLLDADPWQLDNRADDPAYAGLRVSLANRLRQLLGEP
ncbi:sulfatase [bacterium]|nr:sulfatase [bacterium]